MRNQEVVYPDFFLLKKCKYLTLKPKYDRICPI